MGAYVALLRAVNVGGTGKLSKQDLLAAGQDAGFEQVRTYIQSGNLVFTTGLSKGKAAQALQRALSGRLRGQATLVLRTAPEMEALAAGGPFSEAPPNRVLVYFYDKPPAAPAIAAA